jgi:hypothetical protein
MGICRQTDRNTYKSESGDEIVPFFMRMKSILLGEMA